MKFTEAKLEEVIIELLGEEGYPHVLGETVDLSASACRVCDADRCDAQAGRQPQEVLRSRGQSYKMMFLKRGMDEK